MTEPAHIVHGPTGVATALSSIGVTHESLTNAVINGFQNAATCTENDPSTFAGMMFYARTTRHLRDELIPEQGWTRGNDRNYATVVSPDGNIQIAVAAGDSAVGNLELEPTTRTPKGTLTKEAVRRNQMSFSFMDAEGADAIPTRRTWLLLHYLDENAGEIRLELSLPSVMDDADFIVDWSRRIVLTSIPVDRHPLEDEEDHDSDAYNVEVEPRLGQ